MHLRDKGARHDLIDAVFSLGGQDDLALIVKRVEALGEFLKTDDGANLLAGVKRASNILATRRRRTRRATPAPTTSSCCAEKEELALAAAIESVKQDTVAAINVENFDGAMNALAELRAPVDAFFDKVTVNAPDAGAAREPSAAAVGDPRGDADGRGFLEDRRVIPACYRLRCGR